jgi:LysR family hydrogen peroxide-inducible transcriptional activator
MNYPTIKQLRYFIALVDHNHFGKAAESCFVSQSAFSVAIKELENILNGSLVDRTNKSVTITNLGRETYNQAKFVISNLSHLVELAQGNKSPLSSKLSLGIIPTIAPFILSKLLLKLHSSYPKLEMYLREDMTLNLYEKLMSGELDVLLLALPYDLRNVDTYSLFKDKFYLTHAKNSRFIKNANVSIDNFINESVLLLEDGHCMREHAISACNIKNIDKISNYAASSVLTLIEMVKSDIGITYLPEISIDSNLINSSEITTRELSTNNYREIGLVWRKGSSRAEEFILLGEFIKKLYCKWD